MKYIIDKTALAIISGPHPDNATEIKIKLGTGNVDLTSVEDQKAKGVVPYIQDCTATQVYTGADIVTAEAVTREVRDKTAEELAAEKTAATHALCELIDNAAEEYIKHRLTTAGFSMVERMLRYDPPNAKALEVSDWVETVAMQGEIRKAQVQAEVWPDLVDPADFSAYGEKPYSAAQLMAEYLGLP